jgi:hypothetical protein
MQAKINFKQKQSDMKKTALLFVLAQFLWIGNVSAQCLPDGITFTTQEQIDNFQTEYPNCTEIDGDVTIDGDNSNITNLDGLNVVTSIGGFLFIINNDGMINLNGLEALSSIGSYLSIYNNPSLSNLTGFEGLLMIEGGLSVETNSALTSVVGLDNLISIGSWIVIESNESLIDLSPLSNLTTLEGSMVIRYNSSLESLAGIENIDSYSITNLYITDNTLLTECAIKSICDYLDDPNGGINISDNAIGCNNQTEVEEACEAIGIADIITSPAFSIYPNPALEELFLISNNGLKIETVNIYNQLGQNVLHRDKIKESIDISTLGQGIYIVELASSKFNNRQKLIIEK